MSSEIFVQTVYIHYICKNSVKATYHTHSASKKCYSGWRHLVNKVRELFTEAKDKREDGRGGGQVVNFVVHGRRGAGGGVRGLEREAAVFVPPPCRSS
jgi:hypothetical protein